MTGEPLKVTVRFDGYDAYVFASHYAGGWVTDPYGMVVMGFPIPLFRWRVRRAARKRSRMPLRASEYTFTP